MHINNVTVAVFVAYTVCKYMCIAWKIFCSIVQQTHMCTCHIDTYADVIDRVDKEPPFDLHSYLAPPSTTTTATTSAVTAEANNVVTTPVSSSTATTTTTTTSQTSTEKPKKEASKAKLYVMK